MLTLFSIPKPFRGHIAIIQRNAIRSWTLLQPACEIILFGDDENTAEVAAEFGVRHVPGVTRNEYGTPLVSDLFKQAQRLATYKLLCYVNADIILLSDFLATARRIPFRRFLMVGRRWDVDLDRPWDFDHPDWERRLREYVRNNGKVHPPTGTDYFVFTPGLWERIPPFAIGRPAWDNWMIYEARASGAAVIDATRAVMAIHQNHDYAHIPDGVTGLWKGPEAQRNLALAGGYEHVFILTDATWLLTPRWLVPALTREHLRRRWVVHSMQGLRLARQGLRAYREGRSRQAVEYFIKALRHSPLLLFNWRGISKVVYSIVGGRLMARYRNWRHRTYQR
ncbi:MAG: glycosyltransferase family A protein [Candidatus Methanomethyliaceae archaeon]